MDSCYRQSSAPDNWQNAKQNCEVEGAHLVIIENETEEVFVIFVSVISSYLVPESVLPWLVLVCENSVIQL